MSKPITIEINDDDLARLDAYRATVNGVPSRTGTVRAIVEDALRKHVPNVPTTRTLGKSDPPPKRKGARS